MIFWLTSCIRKSYMFPIKGMSLNYMITSFFFLCWTTSSWTIDSLSCLICSVHLICCLVCCLPCAHTHSTEPNTAVGCPENHGLDPSTSSHVQLENFSCGPWSVLKDLAIDKKFKMSDGLFRLMKISCSHVDIDFSMLHPSTGLLSCCATAAGRCSSGHVLYRHAEYFS